MRLIYVTSALPFGPGEPFLIPELLTLVGQRHEVTVVPMRPRGPIVHGDAEPLRSRTKALPLISPTIIVSAGWAALRSPLRTLRLIVWIARSRNLRILFKNLSVVPKGLWLGRFARETHADHLHAHWAATTSTMALIGAEVARIPWSFTAHRWDIDENNLLDIKLARARFARAISAKGLVALRAHVKNGGCSPILLHVGLNTQGRQRRTLSQGRDKRQPLKILMAANFIEVKGHVYLLDAVELLRKRQRSVHVELAGDGPLVPEVRKRVRELGLTDVVALRGRVPHERLMESLSDGRWDVVVVPSIVTRAGEQEGIPVILLEAMSVGVPVIGTKTGGIPELLADGAGVLVPPRDPIALADALESLLTDRALRQSVAERGLKRVFEEFDVDRIVASLVEQFDRSSNPPAVHDDRPSTLQASGPRSPRDA